MEDLMSVKRNIIQALCRSLIQPQDECEFQYTARKMLLSCIIVSVLFCQCLCVTVVFPLLIVFWSPYAFVILCLSQQLSLCGLAIAVLTVLWCPYNLLLLFYHGKKTTESHSETVFEPEHIQGKKVGDATGEVNGDGVSLRTSSNQTTSVSAVREALKQEQNTNQQHHGPVESDNASPLTVIISSNANVGPRGIVNYLLPQAGDATSRHHDVMDDVENLEDTKLCAVNPSRNVSVLVSNIKNGRMSRPVFLLAFLLTHCPKGVSIELLSECSGLLQERMSVFGHQLTQEAMAFATNLVSNLCAYGIIKVNTFCLGDAPITAVALDSVACRKLQSLYKCSEDQQCVQGMFYDILTKVLGTRKKAVAKLHLEAVYLAKTFLDERDLPRLQRTVLQLALGKRLCKVGGLQEALVHVDMAIDGFDSCLNFERERDTDKALKIKRCLASAYLAKGKLARRLGKFHPSRDESLMYLEQAQYLQMEIDGCNSKTDIQTPAAARIAVAICETYMCIGRYLEALTALQHGQFENVVKSDTKYHQAQYYANLGCAFQFNGNNKKAQSMLDRAIEVCSTDDSNYRTPLYFTLMARVLIELSQEDQTLSTDHVESAEKFCHKARRLLAENHSECHRFSALNELCLASICLAKLRVFSGQRGDLITQAISHSVRALSVYKIVYCSAIIHPNVAATLQLLGDACVEMLREPGSLHFSDSERELKKAYEISVGEQGIQLPSNPNQYALHFYDKALAIYERCNGQHPKCMVLRMATESLQGFRN